jgi:hypothetical protein
MKIRERILWILLSLFFLLFPLLSRATQTPDRTVITVWNEFADLTTASVEPRREIESYFRNCLAKKQSPEETYDVRTVINLEKASREFREAADKLDEIKRRIEHPIPKGIRGVMQAKK